jgi:hypothetical protein
MCQRAGRTTVVAQTLAGMARISVPIFQWARVIAESPTSGATGQRPRANERAGQRDPHVSARFSYMGYTVAKV